MPRRTLAGDAAVEGIGLHTGARGDRPLRRPPSRARASSSAGSTSPGAPEVPARLSRGAVHRAAHALGEATRTVQTVEHLLAAAAALAARRPHGRAGRARAADRRRLVPAVSHGPRRRPASPTSRAIPWSTGSPRLPADRGRLDLRRGAGPRAPAHHHHRVGASADRPPDRQLRHHPGRVRAGAGAGAHLRLPARGRSASSPGPGAGRRARVDPGALRRRSGRRRRSAGRTSSCGTRRATSWATWRWSAAGSRRTSIATKPSHQGNIALARWLTRTGAARRRRGDGHRQDPGRHPAPLPVPPGGPHHRGGGDQADRRDQERHHQRAVLPGPLPGPSDHARRAHHRGDGAGRRHAAARHDRGPGPEGRVLHVARQREVPPAGAPGRPAPLRARDAPEPRAAPAG